MNRNTYKGVFYLMISALLIFSTSCEEKIDDHYKNKMSIESTVRLADFIGQQDGLEKFHQMLVISGYD